MISFGDFPLAAALQPPLTVIDQDPDHPERRLKRQMGLPVSLVRRASCCARDQQAPLERPEARCTVT